MFNKSLERIIGSCYKNARMLRHEYMGTEDLLLFLLDDVEVQEAVTSANGDLAILRSELIKYITENAKVLPAGDERDTQPTLGFQRVLQRAVYHVQSSGLSEVTPGRCFVALYGEKDSFAVLALVKQDVQRFHVVNYVSSGAVREPLPSSDETIQRIKATPASSVETEIQSKLSIFISYSHSDTRCLDRLLVHLKPLERLSILECWSDKKIRVGDKWRTEIARHIDQAAVAVLLLSADFLASDFIANHELPPLLIKAEAKGTRIIPVVLKPCGFHRDRELSSFQCINDPKIPLLALSDIDQERLYDDIVEEIHKEFEVRKQLS